jgi:hypothetical protein
MPLKIRKTMTPEELNRLEKGEFGALLHRLDLALYACWIVIEAKQNEPVELEFGDRIKFPSGAFFVDLMLDSGCLTVRKILQFFGIGVVRGKLDSKPGRSNDIRCTDWPGGKLVDVKQACEVLPGFSDQEIQRCYFLAHRLADNSVAHFTEEMTSLFKNNIIELGIAFYAARRLAERHFYEETTRSEVPVPWLPANFNYPSNGSPWRVSKF